MKKVITAALLLAPSVAMAQSDPDLGNLQSLMDAIGKLVDTALPIVVALALLSFFWGLVRFIFAGADEAKAAGRQLMLWGLIALFVMVSVWGIVNFIGDSLGIEQEGDITVPTVPGLGD